MKLPAPPGQYSAIDQEKTRRMLEAEDLHNVKQGAPATLVLKDSSGGLWQLTVSPTGVLTATSI